MALNTPSIDTHEKRLCVLTTHNSDRVCATRSASRFAVKRARTIPTKAARKQYQQGLGLVEVLTAIFILAFGALAIVNLQTTSAIGFTTSADHFKINELSQVIIEQLRTDSVRAAAGDYDTNYEDAGASPSASTEIQQKVAAWKATMSRSTPLGETSIQCTVTECNVGLKWYETSFEGEFDQVFNVRTPI